MIRKIKYDFSIKKINFKDGDYLENVLEFEPRINIDAEFDDCIIKKIEVFYTKGGFMVETISGKLSDIKSSELNRVLNNSNSFMHSFNNFLYKLSMNSKEGEILIEKNKI